MKTNQDLDEAISEHEHLVKVLRSTSRRDDRREAKKQAAELKELRKKKAIDGLPKKKTPEPFPNVEKGDSLYVQHPKKGPIAVRVHAQGAHGITATDSEGNWCKVKWQHVLGAKERAERKLSIIDQGVEGAIVEDENKQRRYLDISQQEDKDEGESELHKSFAHTHHPDDIWTPHHDVWQRDIIEAFTQRALARMADILDAMLFALQDASGSQLMKSDFWVRWTEDDFNRVKDYLGAKPRASYTLDDWMLYVDLIIQRYLPNDVIHSEAEYLAVRAQLAGKVRANLEARKLKPDQVSKIIGVLPQKISQIPPKAISEREAHILRFAYQRAANFITNITSKIRQGMKDILTAGIQRITLGDKAGTWQSIQSELSDTFGDLNRDWRRIAITETGNATNTGYIESFPPGSKVRREEVYANACPFCKLIQGRILTIVADSKEPKDWNGEVWPSKTNIGRSASPRKWVNGSLVPRETNELWTIPAGVVHPHCRGSWSAVNEPKHMSTEHRQFLRNLLAEAQLPITV